MEDLFILLDGAPDTIAETLYYSFDGKTAEYSKIFINANNIFNHNEDVEYWATAISAESLHAVINKISLEASRKLDKLGLHLFTAISQRKYQSGIHEEKLENLLDRNVTFVSNDKA